MAFTHKEQFSLMQMGQVYKPGMPFGPFSMESDDRWALIHVWSSTAGTMEAAAAFYPDKQVLFISDVGKWMS